MNNTPVEFIRNKFNDLSNVLFFESVKCEINTASNIILIGVVPNSTFQEETFKHFQEDLIFDFIESYPEYSLAFLEESQFKKFEHPIELIKKKRSFRFQPSQSFVFENNSIFGDLDIYSNLRSRLDSHKLVFNYAQGFIASPIFQANNLIFSNVVTDLDKWGSFQIQGSGSYGMSTHIEIISSDIYFKNIFKGFDLDIISNEDDNDYALAA